MVASAAPCSCDALAEPLQPQVEQATVIVRATVERFEVAGPLREAINDAGGLDSAYPDGGVATLRVRTAWKGDVQPTLRVHTTGDCVYEFQVGREYVVFARLVGKSLETDRCTRTQPLDKAWYDVAKLGKGTRIGATPPLTALRKGDLIWGPFDQLMDQLLMHPPAPVVVADAPIDTLAQAQAAVLDSLQPLDVGRWQGLERNGWFFLSAQPLGEPGAFGRGFAVKRGDQRIYWYNVW